MISSSSSNSSNLDKHVVPTMLVLKIHMAEVIRMSEDVVEVEDGTGAGVDMDMETIRVTTKEAIGEIITGTIRETIKIMVVTQIRAVVGVGAGIGVIVELDMKEAEVEGAEAMAKVVEGWPIAQGVVVAAEVEAEAEAVEAVEVAVATATKLKRMVFSPFASAKCLPRPVG